jgi:hypothetical protein
MFHRLNCVTFLAFAIPQCLLCFLLPGIPSARGEDPPPVPPYLIYPVATDLQRQLLPAKTDLCVVLNTTEALKGEKLATEKVGIKELRKDLLRPRMERTVLHFHLFCEDIGPDREEERRILHYALIGFAHELGYPKVTASGIGLANGNRDTWEKEVRSVVGKDRAQHMASETARGNDDVKVYPVATDLSRCLTRHADCYVVIVPALDKNKGKIPQNIRQTVIDSVNELMLPAKKHISFEVPSGKLNDRERQQLLKEINEVGKDLGSVGGYVTMR